MYIVSFENPWGEKCDQIYLEPKEQVFYLKT